MMEVRWNLFVFSIILLLLFRIILWSRTEAWPPHGFEICCIAAYFPIHELHVWISATLSTGPAAYEHSSGNVLLESDTLLSCYLCHWPILTKEIYMTPSHVTMPNSVYVFWLPFNLLNDTFMFRRDVHSDTVVNLPRYRLSVLSGGQLVFRIQRY